MPSAAQLLYCFVLFLISPALLFFFLTFLPSYLWRLFSPQAGVAIVVALVDVLPVLFVDMLVDVTLAIVGIAVVVVERNFPAFELTTARHKKKIIIIKKKKFF